jgi:hypothetical protein
MSAPNGLTTFSILSQFRPDLLNLSKEITYKGGCPISTENNKALVSRFYEEVWNKGNVTAVDDLIAPNYVNHFDSPANDSMPERFQQGRKETKQFISQWRTT